MAKKGELIEKAKGLGIETEGLSIPKLEQAIADKESEGNADAGNAEAVDTAGDESAKEQKVVVEEVAGTEIDVEPLCNEGAIKLISDYANGARPDAKKRLEDLVRKCIK